MIERMTGFPQCRVVNVKEAADRREYMAGEFAKLGITDYEIYQYERWENSDVKVTGDQKVLDMLPLGATTSHLLTIKRWYEESDEDMVAIFEDDADFEVTKKWPFRFDQLLERFGPLWDGIQLCVMHEGWAVMYPRHRNGFDHGLQCYIIKRHYAKKIIDYYFTDDNTIHFKMPFIIKQGPPADGPRSGTYERWEATIENTVFGLGYFYIYPIINHNVPKFQTIDPVRRSRKDLEHVAQRSYDYVNSWWERVGQHATLDQLFDYDYCCPKTQNYGNVMPIG